MALKIYDINLLGIGVEGRMLTQRVQASCPRVAIDRALSPNRGKLYIKRGWSELHGGHERLSDGQFVVGDMLTIEVTRVA